MASIDELIPGDFVKGPDHQWHKIKSIWGVTERPGTSYKSLAPPSQGGFGVITEDGLSIDMWHARAYAKRSK